MDLSKELKMGVALMILFWVIVGVLMWKNTQLTPQGNVRVVPNSTKTILSVTPTIASTAFTLDDVARHNNQNDCWLAINNNVYEVTNYLSVHPGGASEIIPYCGTDATGVFTEMIKHRNRAEVDLAKLLIGSLK